MADMDPFWSLIQLHMDEYGVREAAIARKAGMNEKTLNSWRARGVPKLPSRTDVEALAQVLRRPYLVVLDAVLHSSGYLDEGQAVVAYDRPAERADRIG